MFSSQTDLEVADGSMGDITGGPDSVPDRADQAPLLAAIDQLYAVVDGLLVGGGVSQVDSQAIQRLNTLGVKLFAAAKDAGLMSEPVLGGEAVSATEATVFCSELLHVVNLDLFELSLWRKWGTE